MMKYSSSHRVRLKKRGGERAIGIDERGVSAIVGLALVVGLAIGVGLSTYIRDWIPTEQRDREYNTMREVEQSFRELKRGISLLEPGEGSAVGVKLGTEPASGYKYVRSGAILTAVPARYVGWLKPVVDTHVYENESTTSFFDNEKLEVSPTIGHRKRVYMRFDLGKAPGLYDRYQQELYDDTTIIEAKLWLYARALSPVEDPDEPLEIEVPVTIQVWTVEDEAWPASTIYATTSGTGGTPSFLNPANVQGAPNASYATLSGGSDSSYVWGGGFGTGTGAVTQVTIRMVYHVSAAFRNDKLILKYSLDGGASFGPTQYSFVPQDTTDTEISLDVTGDLETWTWDNISSLRVYCGYDRRGGADGDVFIDALYIRVGSDVTWVNQPARDEALENYVVDDEGEWVYFDVTHHVREEFEEALMEQLQGLPISDFSAGFALTEPEGAAGQGYLPRIASFASNDSPAEYRLYEPYLEIVAARQARAGDPQPWGIYNLWDTSLVESGYIKYQPDFIELPEHHFIYEGGAVIQQWYGYRDIMLPGGEPEEMLQVIKVPGEDTIRVILTRYRITSPSGRTGETWGRMWASGTGWASIGFSIAKERYLTQAGETPNRSEVTIVIRSDNPRAWRDYLERLTERLNYLIGGRWTSFGDWVNFDYNRLSLTIYGPNLEPGVRDIYFTEKVIDLDVVLR